MRRKAGVPVLGMVGEIVLPWMAGLGLLAQNGMRLSVGKLLFPNTPRHRRRHEMRKVFFVLVAAVVVCAALACALWAISIAGPH